MRLLHALLVFTMENLGEQSDRKRKMKFEAMELEVLVEEANKHIAELQQRNLNITRRNVIWEAICEKVNAVGKTRRTQMKLRKDGKIYKEEQRKK